MSANLNLELTEIAKILCPKCSKRLKAILRQKIVEMQKRSVDEQIEKLLEGKK